MSSAKRIFQEQFCKKKSTKKYFRQKEILENNFVKKENMSSVKRIFKKI